MKKIIFIYFILLCGNAFAETYAVEKPDGSVVIANYFENSKDSLQDFLNSQGLGGLAYSKVDPQTLPSREDRRFWKKSGNAVVVDEVKKQAFIDAENAKESEKDSVLKKLKISKKEAEALNSI